MNYLNITSIFVFMLVFSGCVTPPAEIKSTTTHKGFTLSEDFVFVRNAGLAGEMTLIFPAGYYRPVFSDKNGIFYMQDSTGMIEERYSKRKENFERYGGIFVSNDHAEYYRHQIAGDFSLEAAGVSPGQGGATGAIFASMLGVREGAPIKMNSLAVGENKLGGDVRALIRWEH